MLSRNEHYLAADLDKLRRLLFVLLRRLLDQGWTQEEFESSLESLLTMEEEGSEDAISEFLGIEPFVDKEEEDPAVAVEHPEGAFFFGS